MVTNLILAMIGVTAMLLWLIAVTLPQHFKKFYPKPVKSINFDQSIWHHKNWEMDTMAGMYRIPGPHVKTTSRFIPDAILAANEIIEDEAAFSLR